MSFNIPQSWAEIRILLNFQWQTNDNDSAVIVQNFSFFNEKKIKPFFKTLFVVTESEPQACRWPF